MNTASRATLVAAALSHLLAACATVPAEMDADTRPTALGITVKGRTAPVLNADTAGQLVVTRGGTSERVGLEFENRALAIYDLPPGHYNIDMIGPLACTGLSFEIDPKAQATSLGALEVDVFRNEPASALLSGRGATGAEIAGIAGNLQVAPEAIGTQPVLIEPSALCHTGGQSGGSTTMTGTEATAQLAVTVVAIGVVVAAIAAPMVVLPLAAAAPAVELGLIGAGTATGVAVKTGDAAAEEAPQHDEGVGSGR